MTKTSYPRLSSARMKGDFGESPRPGANKVQILDIVTRLDVNPDRVLAAALGQLDSVLVVGWDGTGEIYIASSHADGGELLWLLEKAKQTLLSMEHGSGDYGDSAG